MRGGRKEKYKCRACDVMGMLRRASYLPQLRRIVIAHDVYTSSMTVRTRSRPVSCRMLFTSMRVRTPVADVPSVVRTLAKSEKRDREHDRYRFRP